jgi:hypothetical protein
MYGTNIINPSILQLPLNQEEEHPMVVDHPMEKADHPMVEDPPMEEDPIWDHHMVVDLLEDHRMEDPLRDHPMVVDVLEDHPLWRRTSWRTTLC